MDVAVHELRYGNREPQEIGLEKEVTDVLGQ